MQLNIEVTLSNRNIKSYSFIKPYVEIISNLQKIVRTVKELLLPIYPDLYVFHQLFLLYVYTHCHLSNRLRMSCICNAPPLLSLPGFTSPKQRQSPALPPYSPPNQEITDDAILPSSPRIPFKFHQFPQPCCFFLCDLEIYVAFSYHVSSVSFHLEPFLSVSLSLITLIIGSSTWIQTMIFPNHTQAIHSWQKQPRNDASSSQFMIMEAHMLSRSTAGDIHFDHLVKLLLTRPLHLKVSIFPFVINQFSVRRNSDITLLSCYLLNVQPALAAFDDLHLNQPPVQNGCQMGDFLFPLFCLIYQLSFLCKGRAFPSCLFIICLFILNGLYFYFIIFQFITYGLRNSYFSQWVSNPKLQLF